MHQKVSIFIFVALSILIISTPLVFFSIEKSPLQSKVDSLFEVAILETPYLYWIHHIFSLIPVFVMGILYNGFLFRDSFIKLWGRSYILLAIIYILWDVLFTKIGIWGFNDRYRVKGGFFPIEEVIWFLVIPICSLFIHQILRGYRSFQLPNWGEHLLHVVSITGVSVIYLAGTDKLYTAMSSASVLIALVYSWLWKAGKLGGFMISFLGILFPMILFDGLLTGMFTQEALIMYNPKEYLGIRLISIPLEDFLFGFSYLYGILLLGANEGGKMDEFERKNDEISYLKNR